MASTPPSTTTLVTPPTPRHAGEASRHYGTRQSSRSTSERLRAAKTPPPRTTAPSASRLKSSRSRQPVSPSSSSASPRSLSSSAHTSPDKRSHSKRQFAKKSTMGDQSNSLDVPDSQKRVNNENYTGTGPRGGLLPTPVSLPRKKDIPQREVQAAARVLFPPRPDHVDDAMPTPRKNRKGRKNVGFSLYSSMEDDGDDSKSKVQIYTDSRDKVPELIPQEDNPFLETPQNNASVEQRSLGKNGRKRKQNREVRTNPHIEKAFNHDKGMVYVFRGKKIYKQFPQDSDSEREESPIANGEDTGVMNEPELSRLRPLTRSSLKPKLLFPNTRQQAERSATGLTDEEEALTEVEDQTKSQSNQVVTPIKQSFGPSTPPTSGHVTRSTTHKSETSTSLDGETSPNTLSKPVSRKKISPFDSWQRTKPGRNAPRGKKRDADEMDGAGIEDSKRLRSSET